MKYSDEMSKALTKIIHNSVRTLESEETFSKKDNCTSDVNDDGNLYSDLSQSSKSLPNCLNEPRGDVSAKILDDEDDNGD